MDDDLAGRALRGPLAGGAAGDERGPVQKRAQTVVGTRNDAFGEDHQRAFGFDENVDGAVQRRPIHSFAPDAESSQAGNHEPGEAVFVEQVPTSQRVVVDVQLLVDEAHGQRVGGAGMVGRQQDAGPLIER